MAESGKNNPDFSYGQADGSPTSVDINQGIRLGVNNDSQANKLNMPWETRNSLTKPAFQQHQVLK
jgi:hypothetical protein